jgi:hypothetical protein
MPLFYILPMRTYLLVIKFVLWIPIVLISISIYYVLYLINAGLYHLSKFIADNTFRSFVRDIRQSSEGTIIEKKIKETIKKYDDEEEQ